MMLLAPTPVAAPPAPPVEWDDTPCPLCGRRDEDLVLEAPDATPTEGLALRFAVVRCRRCGLAYTNPRPDPESIGRFYLPTYRPHRRAAKLRHARTRPSSVLARWTGRAVPERDGGLPRVGRGRLLDFGCGGGGYMKRMADQGWQVTGLDAAVGAVRAVQEDLGLTALVGSLPHPDLAPASFDVVTMWHSLEHVHRPLDILREAYALLAPGGRLVVACPNIDSWAFRAFGPSWFALDLPRHLTHFTPPTLTAMLAAAGFRAGGVRMIRHSDWVRSSARLAAGRGGGAWVRALACKPLAKAAGWLAHVRGAGDCMLAVAERPV